MSFLSNTVPLLCAGACLVSCLDAAPPEATGVVEQEQIMLNQLALEAILVNSLIGSPESLEKLVSQPLSSATFDTKQNVLGYQLHDPDAQTFMSYLVGCALAENDPPVVWKDPYDPDLPQKQWNGRLGLCSAWATEAPSTSCLELVSACLLARENAEGLSVATSQRGAMLNGSAVPLSTTVPARAEDESGEPIASFQTCPVPQAGAERDCGFDRTSALVGVCTPGDVVVLACGPGSTDSAVRVCGGHRGCDRLDAAALTSVSNVCNLDQSVSFDCPSSGSYTVMRGGQLSSNLPVLTLTASSGTYPATEAQVFDVREAAFYGTLLSPRYHTHPVTSYVDRASGDVVRDLEPDMSPKPVSNAMWACSDHDWAQPDAYLLHRLCAIIVDDEGEAAHLCAAQPVGRCNATVVNAPTNVCASVDAAPVLGDGDFDNCKDTGGRIWRHPITVYLDHSCDVVPEDPAGTCARLIPGPTHH